MLEAAGSHVVQHIAVYLLSAMILAFITIMKVGFVGVINGLLVRVNVQGKWRTTLGRNGADKEHEEAKLKQFHHWVWGTTRTLESSPRLYRLRGQLRGQMLALTYDQNAGHGFETGAILLSVDVDGGRMEGYEVGYDPNKKAIASDSYKWRRL